MSGGEDGVRKIAGVWYMMHAQVEPYYKIFLLETFAIKPGIEVDERDFDIDSVQRG